MFYWNVCKPTRFQHLIQICFSQISNFNILCFLYISTYSFFRHWFCKCCFFFSKMNTHSLLWHLTYSKIAFEGAFEKSVNLIWRWSQWIAFKDEVSDLHLKIKSVNLIANPLLVCNIFIEETDDKKSKRKETEHSQIVLFFVIQMLVSKSCNFLSVL